MLDGNLDIAEADRRFILSEIREDWQTYKDVHVHNTLAMPVILYKIRLENNEDDHFSVEELSEPELKKVFQGKF